MNKIISLGFLAIGVVLLVYSYNASNSVGSSFSRFFNGTPTDQTTWLLVGGIVATVVGLGGLLAGWRSTNN
jgi:hypothetical protein